MTHGRKKPRQPRTLRNPIEHALFGATKLMECEIKSTLAPALECETRLREGVATDDQHTVLYTILLIAQGIEDSRIVRGLRENIASALQAMDAIREAVHLHEFQLRQVSAGELHAIATKLIARTASSGGQVQRRTHQSLGLAAA